MNKLIVVPMLIMSLMVILGTMAGISINPSDDQDNTIEANGYFVEYGSLPPYWYYVNNATGHYYRIQGTGSNIGTTFDPSAEGNTGKSFKLKNSDTDNWEFYDNYADFLQVYGAENFGESLIEDIFDTKAMWALVAGLLVASIVLGVQIFGNGLSEWAQRTVFINGSYGAIWLFLTFGVSDMLLTSALGVFGNILYIALTLAFIVGVIMETTAGGE